MKNIIICLLILNASLTYSQVIVNLEDKHNHNAFEKPKIYYADINGVLNKYLGTWKYQDAPTNPTKIFEITFSKRIMRDQGSISFTDELISHFKYTVNGTVVYDTYLSGDENAIMGSWVPEINKIQLLYTEPLWGNQTRRNQPRGQLFLEYSSQPQPTLTWNVQCYLNPDGTSPFQVPLTMTLIKQE